MVGETNEKVEFAREGERANPVVRGGELCEEGLSGGTKRGKLSVAEEGRNFRNSGARMTCRSGRNFRNWREASCRLETELEGKKVSGNECGKAETD